MEQYSDEELMKMEYNAIKQDRDHLLECVQSWRNNFEEHNYLKNDYEYLQRDMSDVKSRLSVLEAFMRNTNGWSA